MQTENTVTAFETYQQSITRYEKAAAGLANAVTALLNDAGINYHMITHRAKSLRSAQEKFARKNPAGEPKYPDPLNQITDLVGIRVINYLGSDVDKSVEALRDKFFVHEYIDKTLLAKNSGNFGYGGKHLILCARGQKVPDGCAQHTDILFEVQLRTVLQHAWAEFEHDIRYKARDKDSSPEVNRMFTLAAGLIELADAQFEQINGIDLGKSQVEPPTGSLPTSPAASDLTAENIREEVTRQLPDFGQSKSEHYQWLLGLLTAIGISSISQLNNILSKSNIDDVQKAMKYQFPPGHVRIVDDVLLYHYGREYIDRTGSLSDDENRPGKLVHRLGQLTRG
jgi:putative GTP pyrophosphokinase